MGSRCPRDRCARVDAAAEGDPADVSSAHAKAVGAGSDQAATLRRAGIRELTLAICARRETRRNQSAKQATCRTMESLDELWQGLPEYCAPSRGTPLGPETAPVDAAKTRWFDDAPENICC